MTNTGELGTLMLKLFAATEEETPEKPVVFTNRAKKIIREISDYAQRTQFLRRYGGLATHPYVRTETPERIFMAIVCAAADAPTAFRRDCTIICNMPRLYRALGLE